MSNGSQETVQQHFVGVADRPREDEPDQMMTGRISGVRIQRIAGHHDLRGALFPFLDASQPFWSEPVVWAYMFTIRPGRIKGWGMHKLQSDRYFITGGRLRIALYDDREGSPDRGNVAEFFFTPGSAGLILIPPGVWHATQNWGRSLARIVNFPTVAFNPRRPDKYRMDPATATIPFDWTPRDG